MEATLEPGAIDQTEINTLADALDNLSETLQLVDPEGRATDVPPALHSLLRHIAHQLQQGNGITILPVSTVLTTTEAAEMLNVSRPHVVKLVDEGKLSHHMAGTHRRIMVADVVSYQAEREMTRHQALAEMHEIADESGMDL